MHITDNGCLLGWVCPPTLKITWLRHCIQWTENWRQQGTITITLVVTSQRWEFIQLTLFMPRQRQIEQSYWVRERKREWTKSPVNLNRFGKSHLYISVNVQFWVAQNYILSNLTCAMEFTITVNLGVKETGPRFTETIWMPLIEKDVVVQNSSPLSWVRFRGDRAMF